MTVSELAGSGNVVPPATATWGHVRGGAPGASRDMQARAVGSQRRLAGLPDEVTTRRVEVHDGYCRPIAGRSLASEASPAAVGTPLGL